MSDMQASSNSAVDPAKRQRALELFASAAKAPDPDYAVSLYLQGLDLYPTAVEAGLKKLYDAALRRQRRGGKPPGGIEKMKFQAAKASLDKKNPKEGMLKAISLWAKEPSNTDYLEPALRCARAMALDEVAEWMSEVMITLNEGEGSGDHVQDPVMAKRARELFETADKAPDPDYAITLFLQGLEMFPDAADDGHRKLYESALRRRQRGGKAPGMMEKAKWEMAKLTIDKDPKAGMIKAENMWAKDPMNLEYLELAARCAAKAGFEKAADWLCGTLMTKATTESKPSPRVFLEAARIYRELGNAAKQVEALEYYMRLKPDDAGAMSELKNAQAQKSIDSGKYHGSATENVDERLKDFYVDLFDKDTHSTDARDRAIAAAKTEYEGEPGNVAKVRKYANALMAKGQPAEEDQAIELLDERYRETDDYTLKQLADDVRIRRWKQQGRDLMAKVKADPRNAALRQEAGAFARKALQDELAICEDRHHQYPTDAAVLYDLGVQYYRNKRYDDAIPVFQQAQNEPRIQTKARYHLGLSFAANGLIDAAIDEFKDALGRYEMENDDMSKQLHYELARCYEQTDQLQAAADEYKLLARWDYNYKDVRDRMKAVNEKIRGGQA